MRSPIDKFISLDTQYAIDLVAIHLGYVQQIFQYPKLYNIYGNYVLLPLPVSPYIINI